MLRHHALLFFSPTITRHYAINSSKHLRLQHEFSKQVEILRATNRKLLEQPALKEMAIELQELLCEENKSIFAPKRPELNFEIDYVDKALANIEYIEKTYPSVKIETMKKMHELLAMIEEECTSEETVKRQPRQKD